MKLYVNILMLFFVGVYHIAEGKCPTIATKQGMCSFPFQFEHQIYTKCERDGISWLCATTSNFDQDGKRGLCRTPVTSDSVHEDLFCDSLCVLGHCLSGSIYQCTRLDDFSLCYQLDECLMTCSEAPDDKYRSCTSYDRFVSCSDNQMKEHVCESGMVFDISVKDCVQDAEDHKSNQGKMTRILCKKFLSDLQPLCRYSKDIARQSAFEVIPANATYYINHCSHNTDMYIDVLDTSHIVAVRQRNDLMFGDVPFEFDTIYFSESDIEWEFYKNIPDETDTGEPGGGNLRDQPRLFYMVYSCVKGYQFSVISMQSGGNLTTTGTAYIESTTGMVDRWKQRQSTNGVETSGNINVACNFRLSSNSKFYIGGPGTQFHAKYNQYNSKIVIIHTPDSKPFTILPGVMNNLQRRLIDTSSSEEHYRIEYQTDNLTAGMSFLLPIGVAEQAGEIEIKCNEPSVTSPGSTKETKEVSATHVGTTNAAAVAVPVVVILLCVAAATAVLCWIRVKRNARNVDEKPPASRANNIYSCEDMGQINISSTMTTPEVDYAKPDKSGIYKVPKDTRAVGNGLPHKERADDLVENDLYNDESVEDQREATEMVDNEVYHDGLPPDVDTTGTRDNLHNTPPLYVTLKESPLANKKIYTGLQVPENDTNGNTDIEREDSDVYESGDMSPVPCKISEDAEPARDSVVDMVDNEVYND